MTHSGNRSAMPRGQNPLATSIFLDTEPEPSSHHPQRRSRAIDPAPTALEELSMTPHRGGWDNTRHSIPPINLPDPPAHIYQCPKPGTHHSG